MMNDGWLSGAIIFAQQHFLNLFIYLYNVILETFSQWLHVHVLIIVNIQCDPLKRTKGSTSNQLRNALTIIL